MKLRIDDVLYDVVHRPPSDTEGEAGSISTDKQIIRLSEDLGPASEMFVLGHEITHALLEWTGIAALLDDKLQEAICDGLGRGGTTKTGDTPLCNSCKECTRTRGATFRQQITRCHALKRDITFPVYECNSYQNMSAPSLWDMQQIAWSLCTDKKGNKIGFFSPSKAKELIDAGKAEEQPPLYDLDD